MLPIIPSGSVERTSLQGETSGSSDYYTPVARSDGASVSVENRQEDLTVAQQRLSCLLQLAVKNNKEVLSANKLAGSSRKAVRGKAASVAYAAVQQAVTKANYTAAQLDTVGIAAFTGRDYSYGALENLYGAVRAQYDLVEAVKKFEAATGGATAESVAFRQSCQSRACELINFAAQAKSPEFAAGGDVQGSFSTAAGRQTYMHGSNMILGGLEREAAPLFAQLDRLAGSRMDIPFDVFREQARELRAKIDDLSAAVRRSITGGMEAAGVRQSTTRGVEAAAARQDRRAESAPSFAGTAATPYTDSLSGSDLSRAYADAAAENSRPERSVSLSGSSVRVSTPEERRTRCCPFRFSLDAIRRWFRRTPSVPGISAPKLLARHTMFEPLAARLEEAALRLEALSVADSQAAVVQVLDTIFPAFSDNIMHILTKYGFADSKLFSFVQHISAAKNKILDGLTNNELSGKEMFNIFNDLVNLNTYNTERMIKTFISIGTVIQNAEKNVAGMGDLSDKKRKAELKKLLHIDGNGMTAGYTRIFGDNTDELLRAFGKKYDRIVKLVNSAIGNPELRKELSDFGEALAGSALLLDNRKILSKCDIFLNMVQGLRMNPTLRSRYLAEAFENHLSLPAITYAALQNIPPEYVERVADDSLLDSQQVFGRGEVNAVERCTYVDLEGNSSVYVVKPGNSVRGDILPLFAYNCGYEPGDPVVKLNLAAGLSADFLGCGDVIAKSKVGMRQGELSLFMEQASGMPAGRFFFRNAVVAEYEGQPLNASQAMVILERKNLHKVFLTSLLRQLSKLEWADALSGQIDRHGLNYMVSIDMNSGEALVLGIDNDLSFGTRLLGGGLVDFSPPVEDPIFEKFLHTMLKQNVPMTNNVLDMKDLPVELYTQFRSCSGLNQTLQPVTIDKEVFTRLMEIDEEEYREKMSQLLTDKELEPAMLRLQNTKRYAQDLHSQGRVIEDWSDPAAYDLLCRLRKGISEKESEFILSNGFFMRHFEAILRPYYQTDTEQRGPE